MRVAVVGAGPAGVAISYLLASRGIEVTLLERHSDFARVFRGEALMPSGVEALRTMGLESVLGSILGRRLNGWQMFIDGQSIMEVPEPLDELGPLAPRIIPQPAFLQKVVDEAAATSHCTFQAGATVRDLVWAGDRVVGLKVDGSDGSREIPADLVIACDGRASVVRKRLGAELELIPEHYDVLWFKLPAPEQLLASSNVLLMVNRTHQAIAYVSWDGRMNVGLLRRKGTYAARESAEWAVELAAPAPGWLAQHIRSVADGIADPVLLDVIVGRCRHWSFPGALLIGDAAHPMSPVRAQGINAALRDAIVAANHLVPALRSGDAAAVDAACKAVQNEREPEIRRVQKLQYDDVRGLNTRAAPLFLWLGRTLGSRLGRYAWAQRAWLASQKELRFGVTKVELTV